MDLPLARLRPSSAIAVAAIWLTWTAGGAPAQGRAPESVLVFPLSSHWLSEPLARTVTGELSRELRVAGLEVAVAGADSAVVRRAVSEGWVAEGDLAGEDVGPARGALAVAAGADVWLAGEVVEGESDVKLLARLSGTVSRRSVEFEVGTRPGPEPDSVARVLAEKGAALLTPAVWAAVGADAEGRRAAAAQRHAAGRRAIAAGMYDEAMLEFEAALMGAPENAEYLASAAEARVGRGDFAGALIRLRALAGQRPDDVEVTLRIGDVALMADKADQAEVAFLAAETVRPEDPRVVEGLARSARARGDFARSQIYYQRLLTQVLAVPVHRAGVDDEAAVSSGRARLAPGLDSPALAGALAHLTDDSIRLTAGPPESIALQLARVSLRTGRSEDVLDQLSAYHEEAAVPTYGTAVYLEVFPALDKESETIGRGAQKVFAARWAGGRSEEELDAAMAALHNRSGRLAALAEQMRVPLSLDPAHRYRILAYNILNQSNFEALMYLRTEDAERARRADLLRSAFRKARAQAVRLGKALLPPEAAR